MRRTVRQEKEEADAAAAAALEQLDDRAAEVEAVRVQVVAAEKAAKSAQAHATKDRASCALLPLPLLTSCILTDEEPIIRMAVAAKCLARLLVTTDAVVAGTIRYSP